MLKLIPDPKKEKILLWLLVFCSMIRVVRSTAAGDFYLCVLNGSCYSVLWRYHLTVKVQGCGWHRTCGCLDYCLRCRTCQDSKSWFGSCPADFYKDSVGGQKPRLSELCYAINCFPAEVSNPISAVVF